MKNPPCQKAWRVSEENLWKRFQLFSSFLRGASRPKSPRDAAKTAGTFMLYPEAAVKPNVTGQSRANNLPTLCVQLGLWSDTPCETRPDGQLTARRIYRGEKPPFVPGVILSACGTGHGHR